MPLDIATLGAGAATGLVGTGMGLLTSGLTNNIQANQNQRLLDQQEQYNKKMTEFNKNEQLDLWNKTGYGAQVQQMKRAGINPALMFKTAGGAGSTAVAASNTGQAGAMGNAGMSIDSAMDFMQRQQKQESEVKNIEADTEKKLAEKGLVSAETIIAEVEGEFKNESLEESLIMVTTNMQKLATDLKIAESNQWITQNGAVLQIEKARAEIAGIGIANVLNQAKTSLTNEEINAIKEGIKQKWAEIRIGSKNADTNYLNAITNGLNAKTSAAGQLTNQQNADTNTARLAWDKVMNNLSEKDRVIIDGMFKALGLGVGLATFKGNPKTPGTPTAPSNNKNLDIKNNRSNSGYEKQGGNIDWGNYKGAKPKYRG
ncbi:MAG: DNA pilot protein [Microviridae sp.]|nr:MAG: DNA pilot protein [Microviridae sp.]